jgi:hypothetical protein
MIHDYTDVAIDIRWIYYGSCGDEWLVF